MYVLNYFPLRNFILMICDLSGKEERLCEHRTKNKMAYSLYRPWFRVFSFLFHFLS